MKMLSFIMMVIKYVEILSHRSFVIDTIGEVGFVVALIFPVAWFVFFNFFCDPFTEAKETAKEAAQAAAPAVNAAVVSRRDLFKAAVSAFREEANK